MKAKRVYLIIIGLIILGLIVGVLLDNKKQIEKKAEHSLEKNLSIPVSIIKPQYIPDLKNVTVMGEVISDNEVFVISKSHGLIIEKWKKTGDYVTKGSIIAKVEDEVIRQKLHLARHNLSKAQKDVERYHSLLDVGAVTKMEVENVEIAKRMAESVLIELEEELKNTLLIAPITGFIEKDFFKIGSLVSVGTIIGEIVDPKKIKVKANITGNDLIYIDKNASVVISVDIYPDKVFEGKISSISSKGDESMTYTIEIEFTTDYSKLLKPGMYAKVQIKNANKNSSQILTIERKCIVGSLNHPTVYIVKNGKAYLKNVTIGKVINDRVEIKRGISTNDMIVCNGQINLSDSCSVVIY